MTGFDHASIQADFVPIGRRSARVIELDGHGLLHDDLIRRWMVLNPTAYGLWQCLDGSGSVAEIAEDMSAVFGQERELVEKHVLAMVQNLARQGMLEGIAPLVGQSHAEEDSEGAGGEGLPVEQPRGKEPLILAVPPSS